VSSQRLGLFLCEGGLKALLDPKFDVHRAELLDARDQLGEHLEALPCLGLGLGCGAVRAQLAGGCAGSSAAELVTFEQRDLVTFEAQTLGDSTSDDPATNDDDPRHIKKIART
jgi:hypothetical protein